MHLHANEGFAMKKCLFVWTIRDSSMMEVFGVGGEEGYHFPDVPFAKEQDLKNGAPFQLEIYPTRDNKKGEDNKYIPEAIVVHSRPNCKDIFRRVAEFCAEESINRVGVFVCGPRPMVIEVSDHCRYAHSVYQSGGGKKTVHFDVHAEEFDF